MKIALLSHVLPPAWSGQAMMLGRLLGDVSAADYCLITHGSEMTDYARNNYGQNLPGRYYVLPPESRLTRGYRFGLSYAREVANALAGVVTRGRRVADIVRRERCEAVVACTGDLLDLPAGYLASRLTGVPYYPYIFDYYAYQFLPPQQRLVARTLEPWLMKGAARVIVPNEVLDEELRRRYGARTAVIHNPCDLAEYESLPRGGAARGDAAARITYTGAVYDAHFDAFRNLIAALGSLGRGDVALHLYTAQKPADLEARGIAGPVVFHEHQPVSAMPRIQRDSDILFLPLAFDSPYPELVRTSATSKLAEYLAAGRPVLVHAPADSFVSWYFRRHECGLVVDRKDPALLAEAVGRLLADAPLRERLSEAAWRRAVDDFSLAGARAAFAGLLGLRAAETAEAVEAGSPGLEISR